MGVGITFSGVGEWREYIGRIEDKRSNQQSGSIGLRALYFVSHTLLSHSPPKQSKAMGVNEESTPPPVIGKIGPYTVFMTPPSTPKPPSSYSNSNSPSPSPAPNKILPPPPHIQNPHKSSLSDGSSSLLGFFNNAVTKLQTAHSSLDDHLARWFGLNHSKYQWALDDYYETKGMEKGDIRVKEVSSKAQSV